jgi:uncharacterized protein with HEPN domain
MSRDVLLLLSEIQSAALEVLEFTEGMSKDDVIADRKTKNAVIRSLEVMGEAAKGIPQTIRDKHPEIPWKEICGMRDVLIHQYFGINEDRLWEAIEKRVPAIVADISHIIATLPQS